MSRRSAKFRAWSNPKAYLHYGGYDHFERIGDKHSSNPKTRKYASRNSRMKSSRTTRNDDKVRLAREHAKHREAYSDPKYIHGRATNPDQFVGPQWSSDFQRKDVQAFRIDAMKQTGALDAAVQRPRERFQRKQRPRSRQYDPTAPAGADGRPSSRATTASHSSMVYVDPKLLPRRARTAGGPSLSESLLFTHGSLAESASEPTFFRGSSSLPPLPKHPVTYGRNVDFRNRKLVHHLVLKEHKAKVAARQRAMLANFSADDLLADADGYNPFASTDPLPMSPIVGPGATGSGEGGGEASGVDAGDSKYTYSKAPAFEPPRTSTMRVEKTLMGRTKSAPAGTSRYGTTAPENAPRAVQLDAGPSIDDSRVLHAALELGSSLPFGRSTMDGVDVPQPVPSQLTGACGGMAALSMSSVYSPDPRSWVSFAAQPLRPHPAVARFGPLKVGVSYAFPATVRNHGLVARRLRVAGAHTLAESSPADINVRYSSVRLAPGMSATVDILLHADVPGKVVGQVEISSEDDYFVIPVTATFLSHDGFQAALEKARPRRRRQRRRDSTDKLLIPGSTHKHVMVVVPPARHEVLKEEVMGGDMGPSIVDQMEAALREKGYDPQPITHRSRAVRGPGVTRGSVAGKAAEATAELAVARAKGKRRVGVEVLIDSAPEHVKERMDKAATLMQRTVRGHSSRQRVRRIRGGDEDPFDE